MMAVCKLSRFLEFGKKIICVGRNYREHAAELGNKVPKEPFVFLKPTTAYIEEGQSIKLPKGTNEIHHEVELGLVIGTKATSVSAANALDCVGGYVLALDMTNRTEQAKAKNAGLPWCVAKGFDTSCPVSAFLGKEQIPNPQDISLWLKVNGELRQEGNTKDMIFDIPTLISWISDRFTLEPGDLILTGTPAGVGPVQAGDIVECGLGSVVKMSFPVV